MNFSYFDRDYIKIKKSIKFEEELEEKNIHKFSFLDSIQLNFVESSTDIP